MNAKWKRSFVRLLGVGCMILAFVTLLHVPAYHSILAGSLEIVEVRGWGFNTSRNLSLYIHPLDNITVLSPDDICTHSTPPYILIVVCSAVDHQKQRIVIRDTWGSEADLNSYNLTNIKVVFLLGKSDNETLNNSILEENHKYGDIIQDKFIDDYNNLTIKSAMMLKWTITNCPQATYLIKVDDDVYINIDNLVRSLESRSRSAGTLIGSLIRATRPILDPKNKWYTPKYMFSEEMYPNYLSGHSYVMSLDVASKLYESALSIPLLHIEDVYVTGLCAINAKLKPVDHPGFTYVQSKLDACVFKSFITRHSVNPTTMHTIWNELKRCREKKN